MSYETFDYLVNLYLIIGLSIGTISVAITLSSRYEQHILRIKGVNGWSLYFFVLLNFLMEVFLWPIGLKNIFFRVVLLFVEFFENALNKRI
jgi:hypothetical protein